ncbi:MAG: sigma-70 family RNA polymerase sigma factor [Bacteroidetes bacterium]|nr:MAG: sigma-70 family RNA polymerase sigma factor [Bacteroidota bacterium]
MRVPARPATKDSFTVQLLGLQQQLFYYALQLTADRDDALDLVQETSYKALKNRKNLQSTGHLRAWLYTILRNTYINYLRSGYHRQMSRDPDETGPLADQFPDDRYRSPDEILMDKELHHIITMLPGVYGRPIDMFLTGYSYSEIADEMKIPIGTVKSRIHLGKRKIREVYEA